MIAIKLGKVKVCVGSGHEQLDEVDFGENLAQAILSVMATGHIICPDEVLAEAMIRIDESHEQTFDFWSTTEHPQRGAVAEATYDAMMQAIKGYLDLLNSYRSREPKEN